MAHRRVPISGIRQHGVPKAGCVGSTLIRAGETVVNGDGREARAPLGS
jgi:hypothetical protein